MKRLLIILILTLSFQSWTKADDISDFEISGISVGDSLLDFLSEDHIKREIVRNDYMYSYTDKKYIAVEVIGIENDEYEYVLATIKRKGDYQYIVYSIRGSFDIDDPKICKKKQYKIDKDLIEIFGLENRRDFSMNSRVDPTGESKVHGIVFDFKNGGSISVTCVNYASHVDRPSGLDVSIRNNEFSEWLRTDW